MATLDHIYSRFDSIRIEHSGPRVLACFACNQRRAIEAADALPSELRLLHDRKFTLGLLPIFKILMRRWGIDES